MKEDKDEKAKQLNLVNLALDLGFSISIPIVGLALLGRFADTYFETSPALLLTGIFISFFVSTAIIYRKVKDVIG
jgi:F0F1-type ATP synthase assembly protein I